MLEEIRKRHHQDEIEHNKVSKGLAHQDRGHLLSLIDRYKEVFEYIVNNGPHGDECTDIARSILEDK